jgi:putative glutamine amidotransferase
MNKAMFRKLFIPCLLFLTVAVGCGNPGAPPQETEDISSARPLIGVAVPAAGEKCENYTEAVEKAGGRAILIPLIEDPDELAAFIEQLDGVLLPGGADIPPEMYGQEPHPSVRLLDRTRAEHLTVVTRLAIERDMPVLGICLGAQVLNVALGGTLVQDIPTQVPDALVHRGEDAHHPVSVVDGSRLAKIVGAELTVNSSHHQAVGRLGIGLVVTARAPDGVVEAIELPPARFVVGVQWHPERMLDRPEQRALFDAFVTACATARSN